MPFFSNDSLVIKLFEELRKIDNCMGIEDYLIKILEKFNKSIEEKVAYCEKVGLEVYWMSF